MLSKSIETMIVASLESHIYKFGNEIRRQKEGGPIGLSLTGVIAECYMVNWDKQFLKKLKELGIDPVIYERFKDDITIVVESIEAGTKYENNTLEIDLKKKVDDEGKSEEEITMEIFRDIANSMDGMINFTVDYPGNYESRKLAILDIQATINEEKQNKIELSFTRSLQITNLSF